MTLEKLPGCGEQWAILDVPDSAISFHGASEITDQLPEPAVRKATVNFDQRVAKLA
jgi:hypothetical protein